MKRFKPAFTLPEVLLSLAIIGVIAAITIPQVAVAINNTQNKATLSRANEQIELGMQNIIQDYNLKHPELPAVMTLNEAFADLDDEEKFKLIELHLGLDYDKNSHIASILNSMLMPAAYAVATNGVDCSLPENVNLVACKGYTDPNNPDQDKKYDLGEVEDMECIGEKCTNGFEQKDGFEFPGGPDPDPVPVGTIKSFKLNKTSATVHFMEKIDKDVVAPKEKISRIIIDANGKKKPNTLGKDQFDYELLNNGKVIPLG